MTKREELLDSEAYPSDMLDDGRLLSALWKSSRQKYHHAIISRSEYERTVDDIFKELDKLVPGLEEPTETPKICYLSESSLPELEVRVNELLAEGWELHGTVVIGNVNEPTHAHKAFIQALFKK